MSLGKIITNLHRLVIGNLFREHRLPLYHHIILILSHHNGGKSISTRVCFVRYLNSVAIAKFTLYPLFQLLRSKETLIRRNSDIPLN
jgi:hypothetical protein